MLSYNPKDWLSLPFRFHKSDTLRRLFPFIILVCLYSYGVAWLELEYWRLGDNSKVKNVSIMHTLLGVVLSFLLVFRTNTAYERWWEGRKLWGQLVNNSRNFAMKLATLLQDQEEERLFFRNLIPLFADTLKHHLRSEETRIELFNDIPETTLQRIDMKKHLPNQIAAVMHHRIGELVRQKYITEVQALSLNQDLMTFTDVTGACERIKNTPIPYSYSVFIKKFILIYVATLPFGFVFSLGYFVVPIIGFIFYVLASLELIAEEIEEPFGGDENDLPLGRISTTIRSHINELI